MHWYFIVLAFFLFECRHVFSLSLSRPCLTLSLCLFCRTFVEVDPAEDSKSYHKPTISSVCHSRSPSPATRWKCDDIPAPKLSSTEGRPPFVVRHVSSAQFHCKLNKNNLTIIRFQSFFLLFNCTSFYWLLWVFVSLFLRHSEKRQQQQSCTTWTKTRITSLDKVNSFVLKLSIHVLFLQLEKSLIGRIPGDDGGVKAKGKKKVKRGRSRSRTRSVSAMSDSGETSFCLYGFYTNSVCWLFKIVFQVKL